MNCQIADSWPVFNSFYPRFQSLEDEILKTKKDWLNKRDIFSIFFGFIARACNDLGKSGDSKAHGLLKDLLDTNGIEQLTAQICGYYDSIPRRYDIFLPSPIIFSDHLESLNISNTFGLTVLNNNYDYQDILVPAPAFLALASQLKNNTAHFYFSLDGYCDKYYANSLAITRALSNFKITIQLALWGGLFRIKNKIASGILNITEHHSYSVQKTKLFFADSADSKTLFDIDLPLDLSKFLGSIELDEKNYEKLIARKNNDLAALLTEFYEIPARLIDSNTPESNRIKAAIEWSFNSNVTEDVTMSFLQTCIALEAVFGEDYSEHENLTSKLADRCSYLIGENIKQRADIRTYFRELYQIRSRLVHGDSIRLGTDEQHYLDWARNVLKKSLTRELRHLTL